MSGKCGRLRKKGKRRRTENRNELFGSGDTTPLGHEETRHVRSFRFEERAPAPILLFSRSRTLGNAGAMIRGAGLDGSSPFDVSTNLSTQTRDLTVVYHRNLHVFGDDFESGNTAAWSSAVP